jgi:hypothetical protein
MTACGPQAPGHPAARQTLDDTVLIPSLAGLSYFRRQVRRMRPSLSQHRHNGTEYDLTSPLGGYRSFCRHLTGQIPDNYLRYRCALS